MRTAIVGAVAVATGLLPLADAVQLWDRVWPILLFVAGVTVMTELAAEAGLFTQVARRYILLGAIVAPITVVLATLALALSL